MTVSIRNFETHAHLALPVKKKQNRKYLKKIWGNKSSAGIVKILIGDNDNPKQIANYATAQQLNVHYEQMFALRQSHPARWIWIFPLDSHFSRMNFMKQS